MHGRLLKNADFERLAETPNVSEAIAFLWKMEGYEAVLHGHDEVKHRGQAEAMIMTSLYSDFEKIFHFSNIEQKEVLNLIFLRYEADILKICLKYVCINEINDYEREIDWYFHKSTSLDVAALKNAKDLDEFIFFLRGTPYEVIMQELRKNNIYRYGEIASAIDTFYFTRVWKLISRISDKKTKQMLRTIFGTQIDWMNIMWIYRKKHFYKQHPGEIKIPIPILYHVKKEELKEMIQAAKTEDLLKVITGTYYFKGNEALFKMEDEISYYQIMEKIYRQVGRKYPVSMAPVLKYLYDKEIEIERIITAIEGTRYELPPKDIKKLILILGE